MTASNLNTTTYNNVAANTVNGAVIDATATLAWRQNLKSVVDQHATEIDSKLASLAQGSLNMNLYEVVNVDKLAIGTSTTTATQTLSDSETTSYSGSATDGQIAAGATLFIQQRGGSNFGVAQVVFQPRMGFGYNRIVATGGSAPYFAFITNNVERMRLEADGRLVIGTVGIVVGSGSPEGVVTAPVGSLYLRTDGSTTTTLYVKTSGAGNTGWTAK